MCTLPTHFSILGISTYHLVTREKPYVDRHKKQVEHLLLLCTTLLPTQYVKVSMEKYDFLSDASSENIRTYLLSYSFELGKNYLCSFKVSGL